MWTNEKCQNWIVSDTLQYMKTVNRTQTNDWYRINLLLLDRNKWNHLTVKNQFKLVYKYYQQSV